MKNFIETEAFIRGGRYVDLINAQLDAIDIYSIGDYTIISTELGKIVNMKSDGSLSASLDSSIPQAATIENLYELYVYADINVPSEDINSFKQFFLYRVNTFNEQLKELSDEQKSIEIERQNQKREDRKTNLLAKNRLEDLAKLKASRGVNPEQKKLMEQYEVSLTTLPAEADLCIKLKQLMLLLSDDPKHKYSTEAIDVIKDLNTEICGLLNVEGLQPQLIELSQLFKYKETLANIFSLFNSSCVTLNDFQTKLDNNQQIYVFAYPEIVLDVYNVAESDTMFFYINMAYLEWRARSLAYSESLNPTDAAIKNSLEAIKVDILKAYCKVINKYLGIKYNYRQLDYPATAQKIVELLNVTNNILIKYSVPINFLNTKSHEFLVKINSRSEEISILVTNSTVNLTKILELPEHMVLAILSLAPELKTLIANTDISLQDIVNAPVDKLEKIFNSQMSVQRLIVLVNFYCLSKQQIFELNNTELERLVLDPIKAIDIFNLNVADYTVEQLNSVLSHVLLTLESHTKILSESRHIIKLKDVVALPKALFKSLQEIGVNFYQARSIYEALVQLNQSYAKIYINKFTGVAANTMRKKITFDPRLIPFLFSIDKSLEITKFLQQYTSILQSKMPLPKINFKHKNQDTLPDGCTELPKDYIDSYSTLGDNEICKAIVAHDLPTVSKLLKNENTFGFNCKGVSYYSLALKIKDHKITTLLKEHIKQLSKLKFDSFIKENLFDKKNLNSPNVKGELPLCLATSRNNLECIMRLLVEGANPFLQNNAGMSALQSALDTKYDTFVPEMLLLDINSSNKRPWLSFRLFSG